MYELGTISGDVTPAVRNNPGGSAVQAKLQDGV